MLPHQCEVMPEYRTPFRIEQPDVDRLPLPVVEPRGPLPRLGVPRHAFLPGGWPAGGRPHGPEADGADAKIGPAVHQAVVIDMLDALSGSGVQDKSMQVQAPLLAVQPRQSGDGIAGVRLDQHPPAVGRDKLRILVVIMVSRWTMTKIEHQFDQS